MTISKFFYINRKEKGYKIQDIAIHLEISNSDLRRIEFDVIKPNKKQIEKFCEILKIKNIWK